MSSAFDSTALESLSLLEARLRRIEYAILGNPDEKASTESSKASAAEQLSTLEQSLAQLTSSSDTLRNLLELHEKYPDLFHAPSADGASINLDTATILSIVVSSATLYSTVASQLTSMADIPVPSADLSARLIELQPRISRIEAIQVSQHLELSHLRERSALLVEREHTMNVLRLGDAWATMETRIKRVERKLAAREKVKE
ncbi:nuclear distribution protein RO10 [Blumeria hordei DH14]|uniref:Nuclear distribution protein RO10 n=1 Tax=Blumeria graminis f. sp. hordei (strain DH14) TaxID=546991 RepID=N1JBB4_BLUG1|nr:nuclear distribution protein RO10 [Blumeria hordei DH14]